MAHGSIPRLRFITLTDQEVMAAITRYLMQEGKIDISCERVLDAGAHPCAPTWSISVEPR